MVRSSKNDIDIHICSLENNLMFSSMGMKFYNKYALYCRSNQLSLFSTKACHAREPLITKTSLFKYTEIFTTKTKKKKKKKEKNSDKNSDIFPIFLLKT